MSTASLLILALAGILILAHGQAVAGQCRGTPLLANNTGHTCGECCTPGHTYKTYTCSPPVSEHTKAIMTINDFSKGGDGGGVSECDKKYHSNKELIVALSTGWYANGTRCGKNIRISAKGRSVLAKVVDECDTKHGCDPLHAYQPPCNPNIVDTSKAVWDALGITGDDVGWYPITWTDA